MVDPFVPGPRRARRRPLAAWTRLDDVAFDIVNYGMLGLYALAILYPLVLVVSYSFSSPNAVITGRVTLLPVDFSLRGYSFVLAYREVWSGYANSIFYASAGTAISVSMTVLAAYPMSRRDFFGRRVVVGLFMFTMLFSGGLVPTYLLIRSLRLYNTRWALLLPNAVIIYNLIVTRVFFENSIPEELHQVARIDGCGDFRFLLSIVIPLSGPIIGVITLWYAVLQWNSYFDAMIYLKRQALFPLQIVLRSILLQSVAISQTAASGDVQNAVQLQGLSELVRYSLIIVACVPMLLLYPFVQKSFVKGILIGSLKG